MNYAELGFTDLLDYFTCFEPSNKVREISKVGI